MFWLCFQSSVMLLVAFILVVEIIYPCLTGKRLFWSFRGMSKKMASEESLLSDAEDSLEVDGVINARTKIEKKQERNNA